MAPTRYEPKVRLAKGGMAEVWLADAVFEDGTRRSVAVKRVLPSLAHDAMFRSMFEDEARLGMLLRHPCIVRVYDAREVGGTLVMVMELVDGASLKSILDRAHGRGKPMPVAAALHVLREVGRALAYAHGVTDRSGHHLAIVHRDVSPHNILLGRDGAVKLADFGLADASVHQTARASHLVGGKLGYLAPEVLQLGAGDRRVDLFGAGVVFWEALAGRRLFQGPDDATTAANVLRLEIPPLGRVNPAVPPGVEALAMALLAREPAERLSEASELAERADNAIRGLGGVVDETDIALLVGLHLGHQSWEAHQGSLPPGPAIDAVSLELEAFVQAAAAVSVAPDPEKL